MGRSRSERTARVVLARAGEAVGVLAAGFGAIAFNREKPGIAS